MELAPGHNTSPLQIWVRIGDFFHYYTIFSPITYDLDDPTIQFIIEIAEKNRKEMGFPESEEKNLAIVDPEECIFKRILKRLYW